MDLDHSSSYVIGGISGLIACFWVCFVAFWTCLSLKSPPNSVFEAGKSFQVIALSYQAAAIAFYTADCLYEFLSSSAAKRALLVCFLVYLPLAYVMGMGCSLGFGTLYTKLSRYRLGILIGTWICVLFSSFLATLAPKSAQLTGNILLICIFSFQIGVTVSTLRTLQQHRVLCEREGYAALAISLYKSLRQLTLILCLSCLLFIIATLAAVTSTARVNQNARLSIWTGFIVTAAVINGWILVIMRPRAALADVSMFEVVVSSLSHRLRPQIPYFSPFPALVQPY